MWNNPISTCAALASSTGRQVLASFRGTCRAGLYRRAAARWMEVMLLCTEDDDREWIKRRRETCLENVKRPPVKVEEFGDLPKAVTETQHRMGIAQPNGNAFRLNGGKRQR